MKTAKRYFTLAIQEAVGERFCPQFGDYNRGEVKAEAMHYIEDMGYKPRQIWIIESGETQAEIDAALAKFNAGHANVYK